MNHRKVRISPLLAAVMTVTCLLGSAGASLPQPSDGEVLMKAMTDEMARSMGELMLEGLEKPYFLQYNAQDRVVLSMSAAYGGLKNSGVKRQRAIGSRIRVGSFNLDNTNVFRGAGGRGTLPLDDDYVALRHTIWRITDEDYKRAVEILTRKIAYLQDKTMEDRPDDFTPGEPVQAMQPTVALVIDQDVWERKLRDISARFKNHPAIMDSGVEFYAIAVHEYIINSEGTRIRMGDTGALLRISAEIQADDGEYLSDELNYLHETPEKLPALETILADIDRMCDRLVALARAPKIEQYTGPILFEPLAAGKVFEALLANGLCARPTPLGAGGAWQEESLEKKLGLRVLPRSMSVVDDSTQKYFEGTPLAGQFDFDDEGTRPRVVELVTDGILTDLVASRAPTKKFKKTTGHGRGGEFSDPTATVGCLYISDENAISKEEMNLELLTAAKEEGLEFAMRIEAMERGGGGRLGAPLYAYRVSAADGTEELVRGLEFLPVQTRALKRILAAGKERKVYNSIGSVSISYISPAILFEELELRKLTEEFEKPPILKAPWNRGS